MDYFSLVKTHTNLFDNEKALLDLVLEKEIIQEWEESKEEELRKEHLPLEWAKIGVVLDDPYNIILRDLVRFPNGSLGGYTRSIATAALKGGRGVVVLPEYQ